MVGVKSWKILIGKDELPYITWNDGFFGEIQASPESGDITVTNMGIEFEWAVRGTVQRYSCPFSALDYKVPPTPLDKPIGTCQIKRAKPHVLSFLYEFISVVLNGKCPVIVRKEPLDADALLNKYAAFRGQLEGLDFQGMAEAVNLKPRVM